MFLWLNLNLIIPQSISSSRRHKLPNYTPNGKFRQKGLKNFNHHLYRWVEQTCIPKSNTGNRKEIYLGNR